MRLFRTHLRQLPPRTKIILRQTCSKQQAQATGCVPESDPQVLLVYGHRDVVGQETR
jgi:hypothetical protein